MPVVSKAKAIRAILFASATSIRGFRAIRRASQEAWSVFSRLASLIRYILLSRSIAMYSPRQ